ncbi:hypothetical protein [Streptomyces sp. NBC_01716]|uniref:hypothetical protein n=1 Tax=Streptomyces sp. NBC_01716 TaxID=2975917 RepID=UPI002E2FA93F|nr:hypothetical protein [Streptomyces sp. NBC_01716]
MQGWQEVFALSGAPVSGEGRLKHSGGPWTGAAGTAESLRSSTNKSHGRLRPAHAGVAVGAAGFSAVAALSEVLASWETRLAAVRVECAYLDGALGRVAKELGETDVVVEKSVRAVNAGGAGEDR